MGEQKQWRSEIQHGPDGETDYAWVHDDKDALVCVARTHHANAIVRAVNTYPAVADLVEVLTLCQSALAMVVAPDAIKSSSVMHAFAQATEAECKARSALNRFRALEAGKGGVG